MKIVLLFCLIQIFILITHSVFSQDTFIKIDKNRSMSVAEIFEFIQQQTDYEFIYSDELIDNAPIVKIKESEIVLQDLLKVILTPINCDYKFTEDNAIIIKNMPNKPKKFLVKGTITDHKGLPIPGANIVEEGTTNGMQSDLNGNFILQVSGATSTLIVSFVGYITQDIAINKRNTINVTLLEEISMLDEVLVTALQVKRKRIELGYSFQDIEGNKLSNNPTFSVAQSLYGKIAGVNISQTAGGLGASSRVIIRGNNSISGDNQPLYIVDGVYIGNSGIAKITDYKNEKFSSGLDNGDGLSSINVNDIENISVLKGGAASALYGERGANGVIIIRTKKGKKNSFNVDYNTTVTFDFVDAKYKDHQTEYGSGLRGLLPGPNQLGTVQASTVNAWGPKFGEEREERAVRIFDGSFKPYRKTDDNIQNFFRTGVTYNNNISVFGGSDNITYRYSYGHFQNEGIIPNSRLERNTFSLRTSVEMEGLSLDGKLSYITENSKNRPALADDPNNIGFSLINLAPNIDQSWLQNYEDDQGNYYKWNTNPNFLNPYYVIAENRNLSTKNRILGSFRANYAITKWITADFNIGVDRFNHNVSSFTNAGTSLPGRQNGRLRNEDIYFQEYNIEGTLFVNKNLGKFGVSTALGGNHRKTQRIDGGHIAIEMIQRGVNNLSNFSNKVLSPETDQEILVKSIFSYFRTNYNELLFLDITARNDWNSTLAAPQASSSDFKNNYSFFYPSISSSFIFSEAFGLSSDVLSFGKIRASLARTGKAPEQPYATSNFYTVGAASLLGNPLGFIGSNVIPNRELKPEISNTFEIGADLSFFLKRFSLDFSYYRTTTKNQLTAVNISKASGYYASWENIGEVRNNGIEAIITAEIFRTSKGLNWDMILNFSSNHNKVISLDENIDKQVISIARWAGAQVAAQVGKSSSEIFGQRLLRSPDGQVVIGSNGLPQLNPNYESFGKVTPDWIMGVTNRLSYKDFSLETSLDMKFGGYLYSMSNAYAAASGLLGVTVAGRDEYNHWVQQKLAEGLTIDQISAITPEAGYIADGVTKVIGDNGHITYEKNTIPVNPQDYWGSFFGEGMTATPEPFIYDASYVKLRELSLSYSFSSKTLQHIKLDIDQLRISFVGRNLWIIHSNVPNIDPESTYTAGNGQGLEYGSLPQNGSYGFNIQMTF